MNSSIDPKGNPVVEDCTIGIAKTLRVNTTVTTITTIDLRENDIGIDGVAAMGVNHTLQL